MATPEAVVLFSLLAALLAASIVLFLCGRKRGAWLAVGTLAGLAVCAASVRVELRQVSEPGPRERPRHLGVWFVGRPVWHHDLAGGNRELAVAGARWSLLLLLAAAGLVIAARATRGNQPAVPAAQERMSLVPGRGLSEVATWSPCPVVAGLRRVQAGLCLLVFGPFWAFLAWVSIDRVPGGVGLLLFVSIPALPLLGVLLEMAGRLRCLALPGTSSGRLLYASLTFSAAAVAISLWQLGDLFSSPIPLPTVAGEVQKPVALVGSLLFLLHLRNLVRGAGLPDLAGRATTVLVAGIVAVGTALAAALLFPPPEPLEFSFLGLAVLVLSIVLLVLYADWLARLRQVILRSAANSPAPG